MFSFLKDGPVLIIKVWIYYLQLLLQNSNEVNDYLKSLPSFYNPVYISILIFILVTAIVYISYRYIYNPMLRKHRKDQKQFEITTAKILAMFSELDPNPIMRINSSGTITSLNKSAKERFQQYKPKSLQTKHQNFFYVSIRMEVIRKAFVC